MLTKNKNSCAEKIAYEDKQEAVAADAVRRTRYATSATTQVPYQCGRCSLWHLKSVYKD